MKRMPWFKVHTEIIDDAKMARLTDAEKWIWVEFMALARDSDQPGVILLGVDLLAWRLRRDRASLVEIIAKFASLEMVERKDDAIVLLNFAARQWGAPSNEPAATSQRKRASRGRKIKAVESVTTHVTTGVTTSVTPKSRRVSRQCPKGEVEKEEEEEKESAPPALNAREGQISPHDPDPPASPGALAVIGPALESLLGRTIADGELRHIREHLRIGYSAEQIASALRNIASANPRPRAPFPAALSLVRSVKPGEPVPGWADSFEKPKPVAKDPPRCVVCKKQPAMPGKDRCVNHLYDDAGESTEGE